MNSIAAKIDFYEKAIQSADVFDVDVWWDPAAKSGFRLYQSWAAQWEAYRKFGIRKGLVTSGIAARYDAYAGNAALSELLAGQTDLLGCMVLTPDMFFYGKGERYVDALVAQGFAAARVFPKNYMHSMQPFAINSLLCVLEERCLPLLLWHSQVDFAEMDRICREHPGLNIVVEGHDMKLLYHARQYTALLMQHPNFYIETHNLVLFRELETLAELAGCDNLLYGSYFPYNTPHHSLYPVTTASITPEQREGILGGNARRILPGARNAAR